MDRIDTQNEKRITIELVYKGITDGEAMSQLRKLLEDMKDCAWHDRSDAFRHLTDAEDKIRGWIEIKAKVKIQGE